MGSMILNINKGSLQVDGGLPLHTLHIVLDTLPINPTQCPFKAKSLSSPVV